MKIEKRPTPEMVALLREAGHQDPNRALAAIKTLVEALSASWEERYNRAQAQAEERATALKLPLVPGVFKGDIISGIFEKVRFEKGVTPEWPLDLLAPGTEAQHIAYTIPNAGYIPEFAVEGDYVMASTYKIAGSIDCNLDYLENARWDVMARLMQMFEAQFVRKMNADGWHAILAAVVARNLVVLDASAAAGLFTPRLVALAQVAMRRNGGGNSTSLNRRRLTHVFTSPENIADIRSWDATLVDDITRRELFTASEDGIEAFRIFGVNFVALDELGVGQEFTNYYNNDLATAFTGSKVELSIGMDLSGELSNFIMPYRGEDRPLMFEDPVLHRQRRFGVYGWREIGFVALDGRTVLAMYN